MTDCAPCDAGYYCLEGSSVPTGLCEKGYYCPTDITNTYGSVPALIGSYGSRQVKLTVNVKWLIFVNLKVQIC